MKIKNLIKKKLKKKKNKKDEIVELETNKKKSWADIMDENIYLNNLDKNKNKTQINYEKIKIIDLKKKLLDIELEFNELGYNFQYQFKINEE